MGVFSQSLADCENGEVHGTAVAEAVIDIAPGATLYIADPYSQGDVHDIVDWMISEGVAVINVSLGWPFNGPGDGTSPFSWSALNAVDRAVESGILWVNAAGNEARATWFSNSPTIYTSSTTGNRFVAFDGSEDFVNLLFGVGDSELLQLRWDDSWDGASSDLDIGLFDFTQNSYVLITEDRQTGQAGDVPQELLQYQLVEGRLYGITVIHRSGEIPDWIQLQRYSGIDISYHTISGSITNPAESANLGMLTVGATHYWDTHTIAPYSSRGPTPDGRVKPDIVGTACAETESYEHYLRNGQDCWFPGTSQASPHVAGLAALVKQRFPNFTPEQVASYLKDNAQERGTSGPDNTWGSGFAVLPPVGTPPPSPDRDTLVALYNATDGPNWPNNGGWLTNAPISEWHGVTTNDSGRVTRLELSENQLTGEIPAGLGNLANLTGLYLNNNQLSGEIPAGLGNLTNLTRLYLNNNQLSGEIPAELGNLANLTRLYLSNNQLTGCVPAGLRYVPENDFDHLGLDFCEDGTPAPGGCDIADVATDGSAGARDVEQ